MIDKAVDEVLSEMFDDFSKDVALLIESKITEGMQYDQNFMLDLVVDVLQKAYQKYNRAITPNDVRTAMSNIAKKHGSTDLGLDSPEVIKKVMDGLRAQKIPVIYQR